MGVSSSLPIKKLGQGGSLWTTDGRMNKPFKILSQLGNWPKFAQPIQGSYQDILALKPTVRPPHLLSISVPQSWNQNVSTGEASIRSCRSVC